MKSLLLKKPWPLIFLLVLALGAGNCMKTLGVINFQVNDSANLAVPASGPQAGTTLALPGATVATTAAAAYAANGTTADYVQDVSLDHLTLTVATPATQNFDFLRSARVYIASDTTGTNKTLLATLEAVPKGQTAITLAPAGNKFDLYLHGPSYALLTTLELAQPPHQTTTLRADISYRVTANRGN